MLQYLLCIELLKYLNMLESWVWCEYLEVCFCESKSSTAFWDAAGQAQTLISKPGLKELKIILLFKIKANRPCPLLNYYGKVCRPGLRFSLKTSLSEFSCPSPSPLPPEMFLCSCRLPIIAPSKNPISSRFLKVQIRSSGSYNVILGPSCQLI